HALGRFDQLLHEVAKDPAMLIFLDAASSRRGAPNENFAREVMELFTLGAGHYREDDIRQAARAFTGWSIDLDSGQYIFRRLQHDGGEKTVLGQTGNLDGDAVLDVLLAQPATAEFIVRKLWREFVSPQPDEGRVRSIATAFRNGWNIAVPVRALLLQPEVVARDIDNALVKSPAELVVGFLRQSGGELTRPVAAAVSIAGMGQNLFSPPNVRGWPGGEAWINTQTLLARKAFLERGLSDRTVAETSIGEPMATSMKDDDTPRRRLQMLEQSTSVRIDTEAWLKRAGMAPERVAIPASRSKLEQMLLVVPPTAATGEGVLGLDALRATLLDPAYQLK
ncbi:MAG: DUF1800 domain-containing protein, partial [Pseudomonadota bacterium]|nr:DUF1800 domain-containing protein [Pseudomonadota bacterium]